MLVSLKFGAIISRECALSMIRTAFLLTHPHPPFVDRFMPLVSLSKQVSASRRSESLFVTPISCAGNMSQGRETCLNSAPLNRIYPRSWIWHSQVNRVVEETSTLGFSELNALTLQRLSVLVSLR